MGGASLYRTTVTAVGPEAAELVESGVLILFDRGAPPELAEVSVLHDGAGPVGRAPVGGDVVCVGPETMRITAVGETAWQKVRDIGHVVFSFTGAETASRPGEICLDPIEPGTLLSLLVPGAVIEVRAAHAEGPGR